MKMDCDVIRDLLPLYTENMLSQKSQDLVEEHLADCPACQKALAEMGDDRFKVVPQLDPLKKFKRTFRKHTITVALITAFITVAVLILVQGLYFMQPGDELGYVILCFYLLLPAAAFICSLIAGLRPSPVKWGLPLIFGAVGGILPWLIFHTMDMIYLWFAFIPSAAGLLIATIIKLIKSHSKK